MRKPKKVVVLTGAGISQESGLPTFRGSDGLWEGHRVEDVASPEGFRRNPNLVYEFYNQRRRALLSPSVQPNAAHRALAEWEKTFEPGCFMLVTQNIDDLHSRAGSKAVFHMHGELLKSRCIDTGHLFDWQTDLTAKSAHPDDSTKVGRLRPHVVWFGEMPLYLEEIEVALRKCDMFIAIGTSGNVYPASGFVNRTRPDAYRVELNLDPTVGSSAFQEHVRGKATEIVPEFIDRFK